VYKSGVFEQRCGFGQQQQQQQGVAGPVLNQQQIPRRQAALYSVGTAYVYSSSIRVRRRLQLQESCVPQKFRAGVCA
jgi:hypothetical protein